MYVRVCVRARACVCAWVCRNKRLYGHGIGNDWIIRSALWEHLGLCYWYSTEHSVGFMPAAFVGCMLVILNSLLPSNGFSSKQDIPEAHPRVIFKNTLFPWQLGTQSLSLSRCPCLWFPLPNLLRRTKKIISGMKPRYPDDFISSTFLAGQNYHNTYLKKLN